MHELLVRQYPFEHLSHALPVYPTLQLHWPVPESQLSISTEPFASQLHLLIQPNRVKLKYPCSQILHFKPAILFLQLHWPFSSHIGLIEPNGSQLHWFLQPEVKLNVDSIQESHLRPCTNGDIQSHWPVFGSHELNSDEILTVANLLQIHWEQPNGFSLKKLKWPSLHRSHFKPATFCLQLHWAVFYFFNILII